MPCSFLSVCHYDHKQLCTCRKLHTVNAPVTFFYSHPRHRYHHTNNNAGKPSEEQKNQSSSRLLMKDILIDLIRLHATSMKGSQHWRKNTWSKKEEKIGSAQRAHKKNDETEIRVFAEKFFARVWLAGLQHWLDFTTFIHFPRQQLEMLVSLNYLTIYHINN